MILALTLLLLPTLALAQAPCTHWASPTGQGASCTQQAPCKVSSFWPLAGPGKTLCLKDGLYQGGQSMIAPPAGLRGTQAQPITLRAEHDGQVLLDGAHGVPAVHIAWHGGGTNDNQWFVVEGVNAKNGGQDGLYLVSGSNNIVSRTIGWDGTSGAADANIYRIVGYNSRAIDCAGWGMNSRKIFDGAQAGNLLTAGFRRCWGEWNDAPMGVAHPTNSLQLGYNTTNQLFENLVLTINAVGDTDESEGMLSMMHNQYGQPNNIDGTRVLGAILYYRPGARPAGYPLVGGGMSHLRLRDIAMFVPADQPLVPPARLLGRAGNCGNPTPCTDNLCTNCLAVHAGTPLINESESGWTLPGLRQGQGLQAATGGESPFVLLPGICKRYVNGELTTEALWPWPMNQRIQAARVASGFPSVDVTAEVEALLGPIPAACRSGGTEPPIPPEPPVRPQATPLSCVGVMGEGNQIAVACVPTEGRR